ncbi:MAG: 5-amino-6-(D-ribitylamino)uracil--L-tyrosine 4-hydroxyphenyl transferase CofH [Gammaproteobacteria bacterium]
MDSSALPASGQATALFTRAAALRDAGHGDLISYSRKVFIPLTHLCRDVCHYCTFARTPRQGEAAYLTPDQVLDIARAGARAGCHEALFTLGDKPELRYSAARAELARLGHGSTLSYLAEMCALVLRETSLLPHVNPGVMSHGDIAMLRRVAVSQGIMLESASERLCAKGGPHFGSPDKRPAVRLETIRLAGELGVPFTSGILIGIGETRAERVEALLALRELHARYGHIQEVIIQNFRPKPGTKMAGAAAPDLDDLLWTVAVARIMFGPAMNIQAPPNLTPAEYPQLIAAGINDWGGVSPLTPDYVNPEAPWPQIEALRRRTAEAGKTLVERLAVYPAYALNAERWQDAKLAPRVLRTIDADGFARSDGWSPGALTNPPERGQSLTRGPSFTMAAVLAKAAAGEGLEEGDIVTLFGARGADFHAVCRTADELRRAVSGDIVRYVVNRNINYTNVCSFKCRFCAFSKGRLSDNLRGAPYDLALEEVQRRVREAWARGATEVCMQGGIHPDYTGATYLALCRAVKEAAPEMHLHAFSPLEVTQGAKTLGVTVAEFLERLRQAGLGTLPGTAAEILADEVRAVICPDKLTTAEWLETVEQTHRAGFRTTATIMFGHVDSPRHWARHLLSIRDLQARTGGFTEFVPLPFVPMEAPLYLRGRARSGPTFREVVLMHAVARLVLHPVLSNIQVSWVKMGPEGAQACLQAGANDLGGTLMNESISRAAGAQHGEEMPPVRMDALITALGRIPAQRTTLYQPVTAERRRQSYQAPALQAVVLTPAAKYARTGRESRLEP